KPPWISLELCALVALAKSPLSIKATLRPRKDASRATQAPVMPPPMTSRSKVSFARRSRARRMAVCPGGSAACQASGGGTRCRKRTMEGCMPQIRANGIQLEYDEIGPKDGIPYLMINGFGAQMTGWPDEFREGLAAKGLRVIRFDNRDVGLSQKFPGTVPVPGEVAK